MKMATRLALTMVLGMATLNAHAQPYPAKPVRMIVVFPPGSGTDIAARLVAQELSEKFGKSFVIDNRAGAGGMIGTEAAANSNPDGYTLLVNSSAHVIAPSLYPGLGYDPARDFAAVIPIGVSPAA